MDVEVVDGDRISKAVHNEVPSEKNIMCDEEFQTDYGDTGNEYSSEDEDEDAEMEDMKEYYAFDTPDSEIVPEDVPVIKTDDPEHFEYQCLDRQEVISMMQEASARIMSRMQVTVGIAKVLLRLFKWDVDLVLETYELMSADDFMRLSVRMHAVKAEDERIPIREVVQRAMDNTEEAYVDEGVCLVCYEELADNEGLALMCRHRFCDSCWFRYITLKVSEGNCLNILCMEEKCMIPVNEEIITSYPEVRKLLKPQDLFVHDISNHPLMRFCSGPDCDKVFVVKISLARKITCTACEQQMCFKCGEAYHAPATCVNIKEWMLKCDGDSETANYFSAFTKDCPKCNICIEKNGGCNHMMCSKCKFNFCWICLGDWRDHGVQYYECSKFKMSKTQNTKARSALTKYLHYYDRWRNHARSRSLEDEMVTKIEARVQKNVMAGVGTWIDWQYLLDAAALLARCRYTLQYTYPYAFFLDDPQMKSLFEYQQGIMEAEVEELSWKIEHAETTDRGAIENQMHIAEKRRRNLLQSFMES